MKKWFWRTLLLLGAGVTGLVVCNLWGGGPRNIRVSPETTHYTAPVRNGRVDYVERSEWDEGQPGQNDTRMKLDLGFRT